MKLSSCIDIISGGTPDTKNELYWNGNIPWISIKDFNNNRYIYSTEKSITEVGLKNSSTNLLDKNDIIISARGTVGCLSQLTKTMAFNQSCYGIRSNKNELLQNYLYYWLVANIYKFKKNVHGAVFDTITKDTFNTINIEIPPINIQQHIIDIIVCLLFLLFLMLILYSFQVNLLVLLIQLLFVLLFLLETCYCYHLLQHIFLILMNNH